MDSRPIVGHVVLLFHCKFRKSDDEIVKSQIDELVKEAEVVKEMYELLDKFAVPTPPEDFAVYAVSFGIHFNEAHLIGFKITHTDSGSLDKCPLQLY